MGLHQQKFASVVMGVLIMEDILAIVMMVMLTAVAQGKGADGSQMLYSVLKIVFFLVRGVVRIQVVAGEMGAFHMDSFS